MKQATKTKLLKTFRTAHGWLGVFVFPWILVIGLTGLYQNNSKLVLGWIGSTNFDESQFADWPGARPVTLPEATTIANSVWPDEKTRELVRKPYHDMDSYVFKKPSGQIIVTLATGHYYVKTSLTNRLFGPDGTELFKKIYWGSAFSWLHSRGWLSNRFGTWLADITAASMVVFSLTGMIMFIMPRFKKCARWLKKTARRKPDPQARRQNT